MDSDRLQRIKADMRRDEFNVSHLAIGALLIISILYAATII